MQTPLYQSEIAPPHLRGLLVGTFGIFNVLGYNIANWSGAGFYHLKNSNIAWRMIFVIVGGLSIVHMILIYFCPESPRWLVMKNRMTEAEEVIRLIHGDSGNDTFVRLETLQIERQVATEREYNVSYYQMFADKRWRRRTLLCCLIGTVGQVCAPKPRLTSSAMVLIRSVSYSPLGSLLSTIMARISTRFSA